MKTNYDEFQKQCSTMTQPQNRNCFCFAIESQDSIWCCYLTSL